MPGVDMPAFCDRCGRRLGGGIYIENAQNVSLGSNIIRCPCGGVGRMPDGTFNVGSDGRLEVVAATPEGRETLRRAGLLIDRLLDEGLEPADVVDRVAKEVSPEVANSLPRTRSGLRRAAKWSLSTFAAGVIGAAGGAAYQVAESRTFDGRQPTPTELHVHLPPGTEGGYTVTGSGIVIHWRPGTRPTDRPATAP